MIGRWGGSITAGKAAPVGEECAWQEAWLSERGGDLSFKACIWAGCFPPDLEGFPAPRVPIAEDAFMAVFARFGDRDESGRLIPPRRAGGSADGRRKVLGFIGREYVIFHRAGFVEVVFGGVEPRMHGFLAAVCRELDCQLLDANNLEWVTDVFPGLADQAVNRPGSASEPNERL
jgi:hypothetical protein